MAEQFIKNPSITPGDLNIELSGGYVTAISGHPVGGTGGGGGPSVVYSGVVGEITVDNQQGTIGIADEIKNSINSKASKVELNTTYNTLNEAKQDKLTFGYDDTAISSINGSALAGTGGGDYTAGVDLKIENNIISVDTNGNPNNTASNTRNFVEGSWTVASGYMNHAEGVATSALGYGVHAQGMWTKFSSNDGQLNGGGTGPIYWAAGAGATVEGYCNATTSCPMSGEVGQEDYGPIHGGVLKVIGNGYVENEDHETDVHVPHPSDALIIFKDGTISAFGDIFNDGKKYVTEDVFDDYYSKTETSSKQEISAAIKDFITSSDVLQYNVTAVAGIEVTTATDAGVRTFGISVTSTPVVTDTKLSGFNGIQAYEDGNTSGLWDVGLTQDMVNTINGKLDSSVAAQTYQPKGDYLSANALNSLSGKWETVEDKLDTTAFSNVSGTFLTAHQSLDGYATETLVEETSGAITSLIPTNYYPDNNPSGFISGVDLTPYQTTAGMTAYQPAGDYATSSNLVANNQYTLTTFGWSAVTIPDTLSAGSGVEIVSNKINTLLGTDLAFNATTSAIQINTDGSAYGTHAFVEGTNTTASGNGAHAEGTDAGAYGQGAHAGGYGTHTTGVGNFIHGTFLNFASPDGTTNSNTPVFVGGTLNATSAQDYTDHGGYLQIMGNGTYVGAGQGNNSDAYILYRDGTVSAKQFQNADGTETINGTTYNFSGVDNIEILPLAATANTANFPNDNVLRFILES